MVMLITMLVMCIVIMVRNNSDFGLTLKSFPFTIIFSILTLPAIVFVGAMLGVHTYLLLTDITTK